MNKKTIVFGASQNPERYSNMAVKKLQAHGHDVVAIGRRFGKINTINIGTEKLPLTDIDTVTVYLNPKNQEQYEDYILKIQPKRAIFNPGAENIVFAEKLEKAGVQTINACTLVLLSTNQY